MTYSTRMKITEIGDAHQIMCEIRHPMESGDRRDPNSGNRIPANYITQVVFRVNEEIRAELLLGRYVSINPVVGTQLDDLSMGDRVHVRWQDISGNSGETVGQIG